MSAAARLHEAGFTVALNPAGGLLVKPASKLTDEIRQYIRSHLDQLKTELRTPVSPVRAWLAILVTGERVTCINVTGADQDEVLQIARETFGHGCVLSVEVQP